MPRVDGTERDRNIIQHILDYCKDIETTHAEFGCSKEKFLSTRTYQNAVGISSAFLYYFSFQFRLYAAYHSANLRRPSRMPMRGVKP